MRLRAQLGYGEVTVKIKRWRIGARGEAETGPPLVRKASEDNAKTWKFAPHAPNTFHVTFRYRISSGEVEVNFLKSPGIVELEAPAPVTSIDYSAIGLGTWNARLKSAHGKTSLGLKLAYSGPDGDWLYVSLVGKEDDEETDFGHKEGDFLAFVPEGWTTPSKVARERDYADWTPYISHPKSATNYRPREPIGDDTGVSTASARTHDYVLQFKLEEFRISRSLKEVVH